MSRQPIILAALVLASLTAPAAANAATGDRFGSCMRVAEACGRHVEEGDIPYASFRDRSGKRPLVRVCVRDRDGRYCLPRRRPPGRSGLLLQPVLYENTGWQLTTWRVKGRVVGRWRWHVAPESEQR